MITATAVPQPRRADVTAAEWMAGTVSKRGVLVCRGGQSSRAIVTGEISRKENITADAVSQRLLSLPFFRFLAEKDQDYVIDRARRIVLARRR